MCAERDMVAAKCETRLGGVPFGTWLGGVPFGGAAMGSTELPTGTS
ncbi:hypothetical protein GCM10023319_09160 [Nocardia iowensis]